MQPRIMYIEDKGGGVTGDGRIGLVRFSKTGKTLYYRGRSFETLKGYGYKANYFDTETLEHHWISGPRGDGNDSLYSAVVEVDDDVREEYWMHIRRRPDLSQSRTYRSPGKHNGRSDYKR